MKNKNGAFRSKDGSIWIDINAEQGLLGALSHELTHFMKSLNNAKFKEIANILIDEYGKARVPLEDVIKDYMTKLDCSRELAFEEYVCDCMTKMLSDTNAAETLARLRIADRKIADGFIKYIHKAIDGIKAFLKNKDDKQFGNLTLQLNKLQHIADLWAEGVAGAMSEFENKQKKNTALDNDGDVKWSKKGENKYGIEVYETSEATKKLTWKERIKQYKNLMENMFYRRTARFNRNGHIYYAQFDKDSTDKIL